MNWKSTLVAPMAALWWSFLPSPSGAQDAVNIVVHKQSGIPYVSGGVGEDARKAMGKLARKYPMQLIFSIDGENVDIAGVKVTVSDALAKKQVEAVSDGPLFFFTPDSGRWTIDAEYEGETLTKTVDLTGRRYYHLEFKFKASR